LAERAAMAATFWARLPRRNDDAIRGAVAGLSPGDQAEVRDILTVGVFESLSDEELLERMHALAAKTASEHKVAPTEVKTATFNPTSTDVGTFSGYISTFGNRDLQGDTVVVGAFDRTLADFQAGRIHWLITDSHSDYGTDVVGEVKAAATDAQGLRIEAVWMPTERAQQLRSMVLSGARLGLSIDYLVKGSPTGSRRSAAHRRDGGRRRGHPEASKPAGVHRVGQERRDRGGR
jgi:HK97 family phage prohead protease